MIVKLKCVDACGCNYFTVGATYQIIEVHGDDCYWIVNNEGDESLVSTDNRNNIHGKWEIVN